MDVNSHTINGCLVLSMDAPIEIDLGNAEEFKRRSLESIGDARTVIFDATLVDFFDSAGMGVLLALQKQVHENGGEMVLAGMNRAISEVFQMIGFDSVFAVYPDVPAALDGVHT